MDNTEKTLTVPFISEQISKVTKKYNDTLSNFLNNFLNNIDKEEAATFFIHFILVILFVQCLKKQYAPLLCLFLSLMLIYLSIDQKHMNIYYLPVITLIFSICDFCLFYVSEPETNSELDDNIIQKNPCSRKYEIWRVPLWGLVGYFIIPIIKS
jgi:hypothetical protein